MNQRQQKRKSNIVNPLYKLKLTQRTSWFLHEPGSPRCKTALSPIHVDKCRCRCRNSRLHMEDCRHPQVNLFRDLSRVASILFPSISSWVFKSHDKKMFSMTPFVTKVPHLFFCYVIILFVPLMLWSVTFPLSILSNQPTGLVHSICPILSFFAS